MPNEQHELVETEISYLSKRGDGARRPPVPSTAAGAGLDVDPSPNQGAGSIEPPSANRGVDTRDVRDFLGIGTKQEQKTAGFDWLTLTMPSGPVLARLMETTEFAEAGHAVRGFGQSERRLCLGGWCWRKWEPWSESREYGRDYESWEWASSVAHDAVLGLAEGPCRARRVDWAWDFAVDASVMADDVVAGMASHLADRRIGTGIVGQGGVNTMYVGSKSSERRLRIYRRDLRDARLEFAADPVLRVELVLRDDMAEASLKLWQRDRVSGLAAFCQHAYELSGLRLGTLGPIPEPLRRDESEGVVGELFQFLEQHGDRIEAWRRSGLDVSELSRSRWALKPRTRLRDSRLSRRLESMASVLADDVVGRLRDRWAALARSGSEL